MTRTKKRTAGRRVTILVTGHVVKAHAKKRAKPRTKKPAKPRTRKRAKPRAKRRGNSR